MHRETVTDDSQTTKFLRETFLPRTFSNSLQVIVKSKLYKIMYYNISNDT